MKQLFYKLSVLFAMLVGLPASGVLLVGHPLDRYLEFPPETRFIEHSAFSWMAFFIYSVFILLVIFLAFWAGYSKYREVGTASMPSRQFPWWGWIALLGTIVMWTIAWSRLPCLERFQAHTFTPLWIFFIVTVNALCWRRTGRCMLTHQRTLFLVLFPLSAFFWWFFEYLNRFVQNWYYSGVHFDPGQYFIFATLSFSTVLPAVLSVREWLNSFDTIKNGFRKGSCIRCPAPRLVASIMLVISGSGLMLIGVWPNALFPLLWVSPLLIVVAIQTLFNEPHLFSMLESGNWSGIISLSLAALICGFFWEMWNVYSLAKWQYSIPYVHRFEIFEMPVLGYAGYLPFGLECGIIGKMVASLKA